MAAAKLGDDICKIVFETFSVYTHRHMISFVGKRGGVFSVLVSWKPIGAVIILIIPSPLGMFRRCNLFQSLRELHCL
jgi:hypothetical protein